MKHIMLYVNYIPKQKQQQNLPSAESSLIPESAGPELAHVGPNVDKANPRDVSRTKHLWEPGGRKPIWHLQPDSGPAPNRKARRGNFAGRQPQKQVGLKSVQGPGRAASHPFESWRRPGLD